MNVARHWSVQRERADRDVTRGSGQIRKLLRLHESRRRIDTFPCSATADEGGKDLRNNPPPPSPLSSRESRDGTMVRGTVWSGPKVSRRKGSWLIDHCNIASDPTLALLSSSLSLSLSLSPPLRFFLQLASVVIPWQLYTYHCLSAAGSFPFWCRDRALVDHRLNISRSIEIRRSLHAVRIRQIFYPFQSRHISRRASQFLELHPPCPPLLLSWQIDFWFNKSWCYYTVKKYDSSICRKNQGAFEFCLLSLKVNFGGFYFFFLFYSTDS